MKTLEETLTAQAPPLVLADNGAVLRVAGTRVPLDAVVAAYLDGATAEEIALAYPTLRLSDVYPVLGYYLSHRAEVEAYLAERRQRAEAVRAKLAAAGVAGVGPC